MPEKKINTSENAAWGNKNFLNQLFIYLVSFGFFINAFVMDTGRDSIVFYFCFSTLWLVLGAFNDVFLKGHIRSLVGLVIIMINTFIIPFSLYSYGCEIGIAALGSIIYVIIAIAISPYYVSIAAAVSGITFSYIQKKYYVYPNNASDGEDLFYITVSYICLIFIALCWRFLVHKLYNLINNATNSIQVPIKEDSSIEKERYNESMNDQKLLKEEIALHIIELNDITGYKRNTAN